jgi:predicted AAA+ superfamily ATPase
MQNSAIFRMRDIQVNHNVESELESLKEQNSKFNILLAGAKGIGKTSFLKLFIAQFSDFLTSINERNNKDLHVKDLDISKFKQNDEYLIGKSALFILS